MLLVAPPFWRTKVAAVTDWKLPSSAKNVASGKSGANSWSNTGNIYTNNGSSALAVSGFGENTNPTDYLLCYNFGFTSSDIPTGATITGIEIEAEGRYNNNPAILRGGIAAKNASAGSPTIWEASQVDLNLTSSDVLYAVTGATQLFGQAWSQPDIVTSDFGVGIWGAANGSLAQLAFDYLHVRIHYEI